jgi:threonine dehydrogenase-like Zn-dependent dehydrogenase
MKAAQITGPGSVEIVEQETPHGAGDLVVVKILVAPLCTEFKDRKAGTPSDHVGHEAAGVVVDAAQSNLVSVGDRVVVMPQFGCGRCRLCLQGEHIYCPYQRDVLAETGSRHGTGTVAQYVIKPDWLLVPVPDDMSLEHAAMACCGFGPTFQAHSRVGTGALTSVVVSGCGPVGLGGIVQGAVRGAEVFALETQAYRTRLAERLGATVFDPRDASTAEDIVRRTDGWGAHASIETSGAPSAARGLMALTRSRGAIGVVAWTGEVTLGALVPSGLTIHGCWHWNHLRQGDEMLATISAAGPLIDTMITHRMPLEDVSAAMDIQDTGECGKIVLYPFGAEAVTAA